MRLSLFSFYFHSVFKGGNPTYVIGLYLQTDFLQIWSVDDDRDCYALHFDNSLDDLDLHSRSQLYEKLGTLVSIFSQSQVSIWMSFSILPQPVGLLKLMLNFLLHK